MSLVREREQQRAQVEEVVVAGGVLVAVVRSVSHPAPGEERPLVVEPTGYDVGPVAVVLLLPLPEPQHERPVVEATSLVPREPEPGEVEAQVEANERRPIAPAGSPQHPLAELVAAEHLERPVGVPLAPVDVGDGSCRVVAYRRQLLRVTNKQVVRVEEPLFGAAERRPAPLPLHPHIAVGTDDELL